MSEEKLTVAELLARRQQEGKTSEAPRRRRRRSLEEGGVSVSELTDSIPRVKGRDPRRGAHALSNSGNDDKTKASDLLADEAEVEAPAEEPAAQATQAAPATPAAAAPAVQTTQAPAAAQAPTAPQSPEMPVPMAIPMEPRPVMVNSERAEITYTFTELRDFNNESVKVGKPGPVARAALTGSNSYDDRPTATIPIITEEIESAMAENKKAKAEAEATETATRAMPQIKAATDTEESAAADVVKRDENAVEDAEDENYAEDNSLSVPLLLIQVFVGLIVGALIFFGFTMAWSSLPTVVTVIMAVVVTGGFVGLANYLRRKKDVATPILAGLVGLALTFGPWLILQL